jgi:hypothetical protein
MARQRKTNLARFHDRSIAADLFDDFGAEVAILHDREGKICGETSACFDSRKCVGGSRLRRYG